MDAQLVFNKIQEIQEQLKTCKDDRVAVLLQKEILGLMKTILSDKKFVEDIARNQGDFLNKMRQKND